ncbi:hypothetical protein VTO73DRAFT_2122 [Trametes versicolor]
MLQIPHLLEEVFNHLAPETRRDSGVGHVFGSRVSSSNSRRTEKDGHCALARSARVCKVFADPALDVLWRELDDLLVLLRILPPFQPYTAHYFSILEDISPTQWIRFQSYARRVRAIHKPDFESVAGAVDKMAWTVLERLCDGQPLLPHLRDLSAHNISRDHLTPLTLLSPSLNTLSLSFPAESESDVDPDRDPIFTRTRSSTRGVFLQLLVARCQHLTGLSISSGLKAMPLNFLASLTRLDNLHNLDLVHSGAVVDYDTLHNLCKMSTLRKLALRIDFDNWPPSTSLSPPLGRAFLDLHRLHLSGNIADLSRVFELHECPQLSELELSISGRSTAEALQDGLAVICNRVPSSLTGTTLIVSAKIHRESTTPPDEDWAARQLRALMYKPPVVIALSELLRPFLEFHQLRTLRVELDDARMDDEDARAFAHAWPGLMHLHLRLNLPMLDIRSLPSCRTIPAGGQAVLRSLSIADFLGGEGANLLEVAIIFDVLFPSMGRCHEVNMMESFRGIMHNPDRQSAKATHAVMLLVGAMWARREHERNEVLVDYGDVNASEGLITSDMDDGGDA